MPENAAKNLESVTILLIKNVGDNDKQKITEQIRFWVAETIENLCKSKTNIINPFWQFGIKYRNNFCSKVHGIVICFEVGSSNEKIFCEIFDDKGVNENCSFVLKELKNKEILKMIKKEDATSDKILFANFD